MWQYIVVYIIGIGVVAWILKKCYDFFFTKKPDTGFCAGCTGCKLKEECKKISKTD